MSDSVQFKTDLFLLYYSQWVHIDPLRVNLFGSKQKWNHNYQYDTWTIVISTYNTSGANLMEVVNHTVEWNILPEEIPHMYIWYGTGTLVAFNHSNLFCLIWDIYWQIVKLSSLFLWQKCTTRNLHFILRVLYTSTSTPKLCIKKRKMILQVSFEHWLI